MRRFVLLPIVVAAMSLLTTVPLAAASLAIVWDDSHDGVEIPADELSGHYSEFAGLVTAAGHSLTELNGSPGALTPATLAAYDVVMIFDAEAAITTTEIADLQAFVAAGGGLFIAGDRPLAFNRTRHNLLLAPYGISFTTIDLVDGTNTNAAFDLSVWSPDPLTAGLTVVDFFSSGTLSVAGAGTKILGSTAPDGHVGFAYGADGAVVVLADADVFTNRILSPGDDQEKLLHNILDHFASMLEAPPLEITIDIKPGGVTNSVNADSKGVVPVAVLTTSVAAGEVIDFDPWDSIDVTTLAFGPAPAPLAMEAAAEDVDQDGDIDMLLHFRTQAIGIECGDTELALVAMTYDGQSAIGTDTIVTMGCK
jgi:hypothetical protein